MRGRMLRPISCAVALLFVGLAALGCITMRTNVQNERARILDQRASSINFLVASTFQTELSSLKELGAIAAANPHDAQQSLLAGAQPLLDGSPALLGVARSTATGYRIEAVTGGHQHVGDRLTGSANLALVTAGSHSLTGSSTVMHLPSGDRIGIAIPVAHRVVFFETKIDPTMPVSITASPFNDLSGALYAAPVDRQQDLVFTNVRQLPITGRTQSRTAFLVGDDEWSLYLTSRGDLVGGWTAALPWLVLGVGIALAVLLAFVIETLTRRRRNAEAVADQRTESLALATRDLDEARAFIDLLVSTGPLVMMVLDAESGDASYVSPNVEHQFGIPEADALAPDFIARQVDPADATMVRAAIAHAATRPDGDVAAIEFRLQMRGGETRWVEVVIVPARHEKLAEGSIFVYALDIDERHRATEATEAAQAAADAANRSKSEFLSRMSHELRTPLNAILGYAQILELEGLEADQAQPVDQIISSGRHLLALINEVLDISRIESGRLSMSVEPVLVSEVLDSALNMVRPVASERGVTLRVEPDADATTVLADRQRFQQIVLNLLTNAVKYNRLDGSVEIFCQTEGGTARISVVDTGIGIDQDQHDRVFAPFERIGTPSAEVEGTGIGLALSQHLAEAMGGTIGMTSELGRGSTFWVDLPVASAATVESAAIDAVAAIASGDTDTVERTVLQIEDNPANFRLVERILGRAFGVHLITATTGAEGWAVAREQHPDLILLDLHLPDTSGEDVLAQLQADPETAEIPVVVISADATPSTLERLKSEGALDYLTKPVDVRQLLEIVQSTGAHR